MTEDESLQRAIHEEVRMVPYDPEWPGRYEDERNRLLALFPGAFAGIGHIGSTAVRGMAAKPIIDLIGGVRSMAEADALLPGALPERLHHLRGVQRDAGGPTLAHEICLWPPDASPASADPWWRRVAEEDPVPGRAAGGCRSGAPV